MNEQSDFSLGTAAGAVPKPTAHEPCINFPPKRCAVVVEFVLIQVRSLRGSLVGDVAAGMAEHAADVGDGFGVDPGLSKSGVSGCRKVMGMDTLVLAEAGNAYVAVAEVEGLALVVGLESRWNVREGIRTYYFDD